MAAVSAVEAKLRDLQSLLDKKLISAAEHAETKKRVLETFATSLGGPAPTAPVALMRRGSFESPLLVEEVADAPDTDEMPPELLSNAAPEFGTQPSHRARRGGLRDIADNIDDESEFWKRFIRQRSKDVPTRIPVDPSELKMDDLNMYDITTGRVQDIFDRRDQDRDGLIGYDKLAEVLRELDLPLGEENVVHIVSHIRRAPGPEGITMNEFDFIFTRLRLAELFTPNAGHVQFNHSGKYICSFIVCDYTPEFCNATELNEGGDPKQWEHFFFSRRAQQADKEVAGTEMSQTLSVVSKKPSGYAYLGGLTHLAHPVSRRWLHVDATRGLDRLTVVRLAVKFHLHPLAIDDIIDSRTTTKIDVYSDHYFVSMDVVALCAESHAKHQKPGRVHIHRSNVSIFLAKEYDTMLTILQNRDDQSSWLSYWLDAQQSYSEIGEQEYTLWKELQSELEREPPRRMREHRTDFLFYEVMDRIVDQMKPIAEAYARRLGFMHQRPPSRFSQEWLNELDEISLELVDLTRSIKPMQPVLRHFIKETDFEFKPYLEDVEDAIAMVLGDLEHLKQMGKTLEEAYESYLDRRMNTTLFVLSVVSAIFLPAQFITGLYGMNFVNKETGAPSIPELEMPNGYLYFWLLQAGCISIAILGTVWLHKSADITNWCRKKRRKHTRGKPEEHRDVSARKLV